MPRTENCPVCKGVGEYGGLVCGSCNGNGFVPMTVEERIDLRNRLNGEEAPPAELESQMTLEGFEADIDLTNDTPPPGRMANQTWRILEEQRQAAEDTIRECDAEIERWTNKMVDAMKTKGMCEAGQRALDGGL